MLTQHVHTDRDGVTHIEVTFDPNLPTERIEDELSSFYSRHNLCRILDVDHRVDETGFEFWHITGV